MKRSHIGALLTCAIAVALLTVVPDVMAAAQHALQLALSDPLTMGSMLLLANAPGAVDLEAIKKILQEQGEAWEEFKKTNDKALKAGTTELGEVKEKFSKLNTALDTFGKTLQEVEARQQRMLLELGDGDEEPGAKGRKLTLEEREHKKGFQAFMRKGNENGLRELEEKAMSEGSDPDGGYLVPRDTSGRMITKIFETSPMRQYAAQQTISNDALEGPNDLNDGVSGGWVGEAGSRPTTGTPQVGKWRIPVHEMYAYPLATQTLLDDAAVNVEDWLVGKTTGKMGRIETTAFFTGTGAGQPKGLLMYATAATADGSRAWGTFEHLGSGTSASFGTDPNGSDKLIELAHKLKAGYRANARWWMNRATLGVARKLKDTNGAYVWLPSMTAGQNSQLLGYGVVEAEDMPDIGAGSLSIGFGDMGETYQIVDRQGFRLLRDPFSNKPYVGFYVTRRVGGDVLHFETFKFLKFS